MMRPLASVAKRLPPVALLFAALLWALPAGAQTTGGVFGPGVSADDRSAQVRVAFSPGEDGGADRWAGRVHYQHGLSDSLRARIVLQGNDIETGDFETTFVQAELQWQFRDTPKWQSALRLDARLAEDDDGADQIGLNWTNRVPLGERTSLTLVGLTGLQFGPRKRDGFGLETRVSLAHSLGKGVSVSLESFDAFGRTNKIGNFNTQSHRIGPAASVKLGGGVSLFGGVLFGTSDAARDTDFRLWVGRSF